MMDMNMAATNTTPTATFWLMPGISSGRRREIPGALRGRLPMRRVAVLGTGKMGAGMARSLLRSGLDVTVWNRSPDRAAPLAADGAHVSETAADAVARVDAVVTMLWEGDSVVEVVAEALPAAPAGVLWVQTSTVSVHDAGDRLPALAARYGARYLDAPVLGTRQPAEEGKLIILAAAPAPLRDPITPLFDAIGARTIWVSERPGDGTRLKLVANSWVGTIVAATGQAIALARGLGLDPQVFLDTVQGSAVDSAYLHAKGQAMIAGQFPAAFTVHGAIKDTGLIADAMRETGTDAALMDAVREQFRKAAGSGHGDEDMAAIFCAFRP
jgi:3-hydroxyisobutyrate dehydrogenase